MMLLFNVHATMLGVFWRYIVFIIVVISELVPERKKMRKITVVKRRIGGSPCNACYKLYIWVGLGL